METSYPEWLKPALGYLDLKMYEDAWNVIDELPDYHQKSLEAMSLRVSCRLDEKRYEEALEWCHLLREYFPSEHIGFIQGAYCLHAMDRTIEARSWLQGGPFSLQVEPMYFYNLGCYDLALGLEESACSWLIQAFEMQPSYYEDALKDPDFRPIVRRIQEMQEQEDTDGFFT